MTSQSTTMRQRIIGLLMAFFAICLIGATATTASAVEPPPTIVSVKASTGKVTMEVVVNGDKPETIALWLLNGTNDPVKVASAPAPAGKSVILTTELSAGDYYWAQAENGVTIGHVYRQFNTGRGLTQTIKGDCTATYRSNTEPMKCGGELVFATTHTNVVTVINPTATNQVVDWTEKGSTVVKHLAAPAGTVVRFVPTTSVVRVTVRSTKGEVIRPTFNLYVPQP